MQTCIVYINIAERKNFAKTSIKTSKPSSKECEVCKCITSD